MGPEFDAMRLYLSNRRQAENLEPATIGEDWSSPANEWMQPARSADNIQAGANIEVIGVAEDDLSAHLAQFAGIQSFDAALRSDGHEDRGIHDSVRRCEAAQARFGT